MRGPRAAVSIPIVKDRYAFRMNAHTLSLYHLLGDCLGTGVGHAGPIYCAATLPGDRILTGSGDHSLKIWDVKEGPHPATLQRDHYAMKCLATFSGHTWPVQCLCVMDKCHSKIVSGMFLSCVL